jgi:hypothetical protein
MKFGIIAAAALFAATSVAASAEEATSQQAPQEEKKICRTDRATGSLTRRTRVCMTAAQWRELNSRTQKGVGEMQGVGSGGQTVQNNQGAPGL